MKSKGNLIKNQNKSTSVPLLSTSFQLNSKDEFVESNSKCYPNCDASVWMRSCGEEVIEPMEGTTTGVIPTWLNGSLLRNGPGSLKVGKMMFNHLFDSSALLHRFALKDGKATYQCRFIQTDTYQKNKAANRIVVTEFGTRAVPDPCHSIFDKVSVIFKPGESGSDNAMISIYPFGDEFFAFTEQPVVFRINPSTLATEQRINLHETVGIINHTSHPHVLSDGTVYNLGMTVKRMGPFYNIIQFPPGEDMFGKAQIVASVPSRWKFNPGYMHTFGVTENYFIIVEQPLAISVASAIKAQLTNEPLIGSLKWFGDKQTYFYVVDRESGELVHTFCSEAFFYLHIINQFEKDQHLVIDICCYRDPAMLNCMYVESMRNMQSNPDYARMFRGKPVRFVLPLHASNSNNKRTSQISNIFSKLSRTISFDKSNVTEKDFVLANLVNLPESKATAHKLPNNSIFCTPELLCDLGCETPRINYDLYLGREYTYFYAISSDVDAENPGTIIKVNVKDKTRVTWCEPFCYPSEPIFVQAPDATSEDDGVVLCAIVWGGSKEVENRAGVLVLCAKSLTELGRCVFETPSEVPKCLHGWFAPNY